MNSRESLFDMTKDFNQYPAGGSEKVFGEGSGESFKKTLKKLFDANKETIIKIPKNGLDASFINRSFGDMYRENGDKFFDIIKIDMSTDIGKETKKEIDSYKF